MSSQNDRSLPQRRSIRVPGFDYANPGAYFITISSYQGKLLFGNIADEAMVLNRLGQIAENEWLRLPARFPFLELGSFVIMPNHVHGILIIHSPDDRTDPAVGRKSLTSDIDQPCPEDAGGGKPRAGTAGQGNAGVSGATCRARTLYDEEIGNAAGRNQGNRDDAGRAHDEGFGQPVRGSIPTIVRSYKSSVTLRIHKLRERPDTVIWHRNYYEHIIRDYTDLERIDTYIRNNPCLWAEDEMNIYREG